MLNHYYKDGAFCVRGREVKVVEFEDPDELDRISSEGGFVQNGRLSGQLAVTRSFGDKVIKEGGLSTIPFINFQFN